MGFYLAVLFVSAVIASSSVLAIESHNPKCPPPEEIYPCTCSVISIWVIANCKDITNEGEIREVFYRNTDWKLTTVEFEECTIDFIPSTIMDMSSFQTLVVVNSTLVSFFDAVPVKSPVYVIIEGVRILRGIEWEFFSKANLLTMKAVNTDILIIGNSFKKHMPDSVTYMWFENTKTKKIKDQAFQHLVNLDTLGLVGGSLKKVSRDMFPRPWDIRDINLSRQKLSNLPNDFFADLPELRFFKARHNHFTTLSEEAFTITRVVYSFNDNPFICNCRLKWITNFLNDANTRFHGKCSEPKSFKGRELSDLTYQDFEYCG